MEKKPLGTNLVVQVAILVHDIEKSSQVFADFLGLPKPEIRQTNPIELAETKYLGKPSKARAKLAFLKVGESLDIELIEPDKEPSTWRHDLDAKGEGVHHLAFRVKGMKECNERLEKSGIHLLQTGEYKGGRYAYYDANETLKTVIELLEND